MVRNKSNSACTHIHKAAWQNVPMQRYNFFPIQQVFQRNKAHKPPPLFTPSRASFCKTATFGTQKWQF